MCQRHRRADLTLRHQYRHTHLQPRLLPILVCTDQGILPAPLPSWIILSMVFELTRMAPLLANGICTVQIIAIRTFDPIGISSTLPNSSSIWLPG
jgi:hypothetical protein